TPFTLTFSKNGFTFASATINGTTDSTPLAVTGSPVLRTVSGTITSRGQPLAGVLVDGGRLGTTTTDSSGHYQFANVPSGSDYLIHPGKVGFNFTPAQVKGTLTADLTADFTAAKQTFSIRGRVVRGGKGVADVGIDGGKLGKVTTD